LLSLLNVLTDQVWN